MAVVVTYLWPDVHGMNPRTRCRSSTKVAPLLWRSQGGKILEKIVSLETGSEAGEVSGGLMATVRSELEMLFGVSHMYCSVVSARRCL